MIVRYVQLKVSFRFSEGFLSVRDMLVSVGSAGCIQRISFFPLTDCLVFEQIVVVI